MRPTTLTSNTQRAMYTVMFSKEVSLTIPRTKAVGWGKGVGMETRQNPSHGIAEVQYCSSCPEEHETFTCSNQRGYEVNLLPAVLYGLLASSAQGVDFAQTSKPE